MIPYKKDEGIAEGRGNTLRLSAGRHVYRTNQGRRSGRGHTRPGVLLTPTIVALRYADALRGRRSERVRQVHLTRTTWFRRIEVIDPDAIVRDTMAVNPGRAAREALRRRRAAVAAGRTLVVETTLAGSGVLRLMETARNTGYRLVLHYVSVNSPDQALIRIRNRVALGGHDVPESDVRRRFVRSWANLPAAISRVDEVLLYDNTDSDLPHRKVAIFTADLRWTAEQLPNWASAALARVPPLRT